MDVGAGRELKDNLAKLPHLLERKWKLGDVRDLPKAKKLASGQAGTRRWCSCPQTLFIMSGEQCQVSQTGNAKIRVDGGPAAASPPSFHQSTYVNYENES